MRDIKCVIVGDGSVGKTCMISVYSDSVFPGEYVPTVLDNFFANVVVDKKLVNLAIWDTAGQEAYDRLRPLSYPHTDVFALCFSVSAPISLQNIEKKWYPEVNHYAPGVPLVLVGTKVDSRDSTAAREFQNQHVRDCVTSEQGKQMAKAIGAVRYMECSALMQVGIKEVFEEVIRAGIGEEKSGKSGKLKRKVCIVL